MKPVPRQDGLYGSHYQSGMTSIDLLSSGTSAVSLSGT